MLLCFCLPLLLLCFPLTRHLLFPPLQAILAVFFGLLYSELDWNSSAGIQSALGAILAAMGFQGVLFFSIAVPLYIRYRPAFYRERDARFYDMSAQALAMLVVETLWTVLLTVIFVAIFYPLIGFKGGFENYGFFTLGAFITILSFVFAAIAAAAMFPSAIVAQLAGGVFLSVVFLFASIFVPYSMMPVGWLWMMQADFAFHLVRALAIQLFNCGSPGENGCQTVSVTTPMGPYPMQASAIVVSNFDGSYDGTKWKDIGIGAGILGGFIIFTFLLWKKVNWTKR
jgi:ABC-type multidrug transport system permease subunit